jgi:hypothetical protein
VNSCTLNEGPQPLARGYKYTRTLPLSFHNSGTYVNVSHQKVIIGNDALVCDFTFSAFFRKDALYSGRLSSERTQASEDGRWLVSTELERDRPPLPGSQLRRRRFLEGLWAREGGEGGVVLTGREAIREAAYALSRETPREALPEGAPGT